MSKAKKKPGFTFRWKGKGGKPIGQRFTEPTALWRDSPAYKELSFFKLFHMVEGRWHYGHVWWKASGQWGARYARVEKRNTVRQEEYFNSEREAKAFLETMAALHV